MTPEWKEAVRGALRDRGVSEQWLADQIAARLDAPGMKRDTVNKMLRNQQASALVPHVCAILGLPPPMVATPPVPDPELRLALDLVRKAPPDIRRAVIALLRGHFGEE